MAEPEQVSVSELRRDTKTGSVYRNGKYVGRVTDSGRRYNGGRDILWEIKAKGEPITRSCVGYSLECSMILCARLAQRARRPELAA